MIEFFEIQNPSWLVLFVLLSIWSLVWKGLSLWKAGGRKDKVWFVVLLVFNTLGILDILYIYLFSEMKKEKEIAKPKTTRKRTTATKKKKPVAKKKEEETEEENKEE